MFWCQYLYLDPDETTGCETEDEDIKSDKLHNKFQFNENASNAWNKKASTRIAANIFGGINSNSDDKTIASSSNNRK